MIKSADARTLQVPCAVRAPPSAWLCLLVPGHLFLRKWAVVQELRQSKQAGICMIACGRLLQPGFARPSSPTHSLACIWGPDVSSIGEVIGRPVTSSESFFPAALFSLAPLVLDFDARMAVECISFGQRPDPGFVSSNFAPKPSMLKVCLASISCRWRFPAGLGTHCGAALCQTCLFDILGLEPAEQDGQETDNFTDEIQHECLVI